MSVTVHAHIPERGEPVSGDVSRAVHTFEGFRNQYARALLHLLPWALLVLAVLVLSLFGLLPFTRSVMSASERVMFASGLTTVAATLFIFRSLLRRIPETFGTIWDREIVAAGEDEYASFIGALDRKLNSRRQYIVGAAFVALVPVWYPFWKAEFVGPALIAAGFLLEGAGAFLLGLLAWRMVVVGLEVGSLGKRFQLTPQLGHPDRAGGFSPLGNLCLWNALVVSVAGVYLGAWILFGPVSPYRSAALEYLPLYYRLLAIPIVVAAISFFLPMWNVHRVMVAGRAGVLTELDRLGKSINDLSRKLLAEVDEMDPATSEELGKRLERMQRVYDQSRHVSVWPFNTGILMRFLGVQLVPVLSLTGIGQPVVKVIDTLLRFLPPS